MSSEVTVTVVGLGNVGSHVVPLLSRLGGFDRLVLVDPDRYSLENLTHQNVCSRDVGKLKVDVMALLARDDCTALKVEAISSPVEDVPPARLRGAVLVGCVDSRRARREINRLAFRLGMPWLDAAVDAGSASIRLAGYAPTGACLECRWGTRDYELLEPVHACGRVATASTRAPAPLGALVASWQALAVAEVLGGDMTSCGHSLFIDTSARALHRAAFQRNPTCAFDHRVISTTARVAASSSPGELAARDGLAAERLSAEGQIFGRMAACGSCRALTEMAPKAFRAIASSVCSRCGGPLAPLPLGAMDSLALDGQWRRTSLAELGLTAGDLVTLSRTGRALASYELTSGELAGRGEQP